MTPTPEAVDETRLPCVVTFNANDPSGSGGIAADLLAFASASVHGLPVCTALLMQDTRSVYDHITVDEEHVAEQARWVLEDVKVDAFKVGFCGSPAVLASVANILSDYPDTPVVAYMGDLSWMSEDEIENYLDAFADLILPLTGVLCGKYATLQRWLLDDWTADTPPTPRDIARRAEQAGASYTLATSVPSGLPTHQECVLVSPETQIAAVRYERFEGTFIGAGETLSAMLTGLIAAGVDLQTATNEAIDYVDQALNAGLEPGMGHAIPHRLFWAETAEDPAEDGEPENKVIQ